MSKLKYSTEKVNNRRRSGIDYMASVREMRSTISFWEIADSLANMKAKVLHTLASIHIESKYYHIYRIINLRVHIYAI